MKKLTKLCLISLLLFTLCSCVTTQPVSTDTSNTICIQKDTLGKMLDELIHQKGLLMECLERERQ